MRYKALLWAAALSACQSLDDSSTPSDPHAAVAAAMADLPGARITRANADASPRWITGNLGSLAAPLPDDGPAAAAALRPALDKIVAPYLVAGADLVFDHASTDPAGQRHLHYHQTHDGLDVVGGDLIVHVDAKGGITGVNATTRGDLPRLPDALLDDAQAMAGLAVDPRTASLTPRSARLVYFLEGDRTAHVAFEVSASDADGAHLVYVDAVSGIVIDDRALESSSKYRNIYYTNYTTNLPGTLKRSEGGAPSGDAEVDALYDGFGHVYDAYFTQLAVDGWDLSGATMSGTVDYGVNVCDAEFHWDSSGEWIWFGAGNPAQGCTSKVVLDVEGHEFTHGITHHTSGLSGGESEAMNESISDIMGSWVESWWLGQQSQPAGTFADTAKTWRYDESFTSSYGRNVCNPEMYMDAATGGSGYCLSTAAGCEYSVYSSGIASSDPHQGAGVGDLAFCLLARGGSHPQAFTNFRAPGIGIKKAATLVYETDAHFLSSNSDYLDWRLAMETEAGVLYTTAEQNAVSCAWSAVAVGGVSQSICAHADVMLRTTSGSTSIVYIGNHAATSVGYSGTPTGAVPVSSGDYDSDGTDDVLWFNSANGAMTIWTMHGRAVTATTGLGVAAGWTPFGTGSFVGGMRKDVLLTSCTLKMQCTAEVMVVSNNQILSTVNLGTPGGNYQVVAIADFDNDGVSDVLWRDVTGHYLFWFLQTNGTTVSLHHTATVASAPSSSGLQFLGTGDFYRDGYPDLVWRDTATQTILVWKLSYPSFQTPTWAGSMVIGTNAQQLAGIADTNGDGQDDFIWVNPSGGQMLVWEIGGSGVIQTLWSPISTFNGTKAVPVGYFDD